MELAVFLHNMRAFGDAKTFTVGNKTIELISEAVCFMEEVIAKATFIDIKDEGSVDFLQQLDQQHYELRRNIMCRLCIVSFVFGFFHGKMIEMFSNTLSFYPKQEPIPISQDEFQAHLCKNSHISRVQRSSKTTPDKQQTMGSDVQTESNSLVSISGHNN